jgi:hypothetical protein
MKARVLACGLIVFFLLFDIARLLFIDPGPIPLGAQKVRGWAMSALRHDEFGRVVFVFIDIFIGWLLIKLLFSKEKPTEKSSRTK